MISSGAKRRRRRRRRRLVTVTRTLVTLTPTNMSFDAKKTASVDSLPQHLPSLASLS